MATDLISFAHDLSLDLSAEQAQQLQLYAACVWGKKDMLNLTSVSCIDEILSRHLADGLVAAAQIQKVAQKDKLTHFQIADMGSGAGYIGITLAIALPQAQITCVESLQKRCAFMNWSVLQIGLKNVKIKNERLGQGTTGSYDFVTERAMGQLPDILDICMSAVKPQGYFMAFQGENPQTQTLPATATLLAQTPYQLPIQDGKKRHLVILKQTV